MFRLFYLSAAQGFPGSRELNDILEVSRRRNHADGVTGLLLYHEGSFAQVLEGPETAVRACFERINRDPRHTGCKIILEEKTPLRLFPGCAMAFNPSTETRAEQQRGFIDLGGNSDAKQLKAAMMHPVISSFINSFHTPVYKPKRRPARHGYWLKVS